MVTFVLDGNVSETFSVITDVNIISREYQNIQPLSTYKGKKSKCTKTLTLYNGTLFPCIRCTVFVVLYYSGLSAGWVVEGHVGEDLLSVGVSAVLPSVFAGSITTGNPFCTSILGGFYFVSHLAQIYTIFYHILLLIMVSTICILYFHS